MQQPTGRTHFFIQIPNLPILSVTAVPLQLMISFAARLSQPIVFNAGTLGQGTLQIKERFRRVCKTCQRGL